MNDSAITKITGTVQVAPEQLQKFNGQMLDIWRVIINVQQQGKWDSSTKAYQMVLAQWEVTVKKDKLHYLNGVQRGDRITAICAAKIQSNEYNGKTYHNYRFELEAAWLYTQQQQVGQRMQEQRGRMQEYQQQQGYTNGGNYQQQDGYQQAPQMQNDDIPF